MLDKRKEFESKKRIIDDLRVKKIGLEREHERIQNKKAEIEEEFKNKFGVELTGAEATLETLQKEIESKEKLLLSKLEEAQGAFK